MNGLADHEILKMLAQWVSTHKNPYTSTAKPLERVTITALSADSWVDVVAQGQGRSATLACVHRLIKDVPEAHLSALRHEVKRFNELMERVNLPVMVWEHRDAGEFQLLWQEPMRHATDVAQIRTAYEQSMNICHALLSRLSLKIPLGAAQGYSVH